MRILGLIYDPIYENRRIHQIKNWTNPLTGLHKAVADLNLILPVNQRYTINVQYLDRLGVSTRGFGVDKLDEIDWGTPYYYTPQEWMANWNVLEFNPSQWPHGGDVHVKDFIERNNLVNLANMGLYDEVWLGGLPIPSAFEGCMVAPEGDVDAYPTHDRVVYVKGLNKRFVWHMFQVSNWNPIHNYWHRIENIMSRIWGRSTMGYCEQNSNLTHMANVQNPWQLFTMTENCMPGEAQVGTCHFAPNSKLGYVHDMEDDVPSGAHFWKDYPGFLPLNLDRDDRWQIVNGSTYKDLPDYIWQLSHIPKADGEYDGRDNNWWNYITNVNYQKGRGQPTTMPWVGTPRRFPNILARYGDKVVARWQPRNGDTDDTKYELYVNNVLHRTVQRQGAAHINISAAAPAVSGAIYKIVSPGVWENPQVFNETVPVPPTPPPPGGTMFTLEELKNEVSIAHATLASNCVAPEYDEDFFNYYIIWHHPDKADPIKQAVPKHWALRNVQPYYLSIYPKFMCEETPPPVIVPPVIPDDDDDLRAFIQAHIQFLENYLRSRL